MVEGQRFERPMPTEFVRVTAELSPAHRRSVSAMNSSLRARLIAPLAALLVLIPNLAAPRAAAAVDVYITPGYHNVNGRQWYTACEKYSSTVTRCRTDIKATQVKLINGRYVSVHGWVFNNLTYKASPRSQWSNNNLGKTAQWTSNGRRWYTECDTPQTGYNGCRSYIWATHVVAVGTGYQQIQGWVFNNMVRFSNDYYGQYAGTGDGVIALPTGATQLYVKGTQALASSGHFSVQGLDAGGAETDLAFDTQSVGAQVGGAIGIVDDDTVRIRVRADGRWSLSVHPLSTAPKLVSGTDRGTGSDVLWYYGSPRPFTVTHTGDDGFTVRQWVGSQPTTLVDVHGDHSGPLTLQGGPSLIQVTTDGKWWIA